MKFDTSITSGTFVTFPGGALTGNGRIEFAALSADGWLLIADRTPVHPVSFRWPDQPADTGQVIFSDGITVDFSAACTGVVNAKTGTLLTGEDARAIRKGEGDWQSVVVHNVRSDRDLQRYVGQEAHFTVEPNRRNALSVAHTAAHLSALALNAIAVPFWTKEYVDLDAFGRPNLDKAAIQVSSIQPELSTDVYRLGKSLKKKGFDRDRFVSQLDSLTGTINLQIRTWLESKAPINVTPSEGLLEEVRLWQTELDGSEVTIPCGGTHVKRLTDIGAVEINVAPLEDGFVMTTHAHAR